MPATQAAPVLTRRQLNRSLLARQWLLERRAATAEATIEHLVGMQAQEPFDPYTALWSRLVGFQPEELSELIASRRAVRAPSMIRTTIHLVTARDWLRLRPVLQVVQEQGFLDERPRSGNDLGKALAERWPGRDPASLGYAVRSRVPVVQIPPRGLWGKRGGPVLASGETWLGQPIRTDDAPDAMVLRYLAAFGPATAMDVQTWCWRTRLGPVLERLRPQLRTFRDEAPRAVRRPGRADAGPDAGGPVLPDVRQHLPLPQGPSRIIDAHASWTTAKLVQRDLPLRIVRVDGYVVGGWRLNGTRRRAGLRSSRTRSSRWRRRRGGMSRRRRRAGGVPRAGLTHRDVRTTAASLQ
jgi:hypothetical protein